MFVKALFSGEDGIFMSAPGTLSRALMWLVLPLAAVMFPRLVHGAAKAQKTNLMGMVLAGTAMLAVAGALGLSLLGPLIVRFVYTPSYVQVAAAAATVVCLRHGAAGPGQCAPERFAGPAASKLLPALCVLGVALGYLTALTQFHGSLVSVLKTMGLCNLALLAVCAGFSWLGRSAGETNLNNRSATS